MITSRKLLWEHHIEFFKQRLRRAQQKQMHGASTIPIKKLHESCTLFHFGLNLHVK